MNLVRNQIFTAFEQSAIAGMNKWRVPGMAVAVVEKGQLIYAKGFGVKSAGQKDSVNEKTIFQIGSVSKTFTATQLAMLVDEGKLKWDDKVIDHLPTFLLYDPKATEDFTVEDLLSQRSGLPAHSGRLLPYLGFDRPYIIDKLRYIKPITDHRCEYAYQNNLFVVAGALLEKISGESWERNLAKRFFAPLQMPDTTTTLADYLNSNNKAQGHYYSEPELTGRITAIPWDWPYHDWVYTLAPAGGINSNVVDLAQWLKFYLQGGTFCGNQLIGIHNLNYLHRPKIKALSDISEETRYYCLGWIYSTSASGPIIWHNGGTSGMKSIIALLPDAQLGIVILSNLFNTFLPEALVRVFADLWRKSPPRDWINEFFTKQANGSETLQPPPAQIKPRPPASYIGTYYNNLYGRILVTYFKGSLSLILGPKNIRLPLKPWGGDTFVIYWPGVFTYGTGVQFLANQNNRIDRVEIHGMNDDICGAFIKISRMPS